jgi:hypothetical protein
VNIQDKEHKRVIELIMGKGKWFNHYRVVEYGTSYITTTYLELTYPLDNEIRMLLSGLPKVHIRDIIKTWGREYILEKSINKVSRREFGITGSIYRL